jgi:hypothetical protein
MQSFADMADDQEELPEPFEQPEVHDPDQIPPEVIGLDGLLAVMVGATLILLVSGYALHHVGAAVAVAIGLSVIALVLRAIVRKERRAGRTM